MDALTGLLTGPRAEGAFLVRSILSSPWSLRIQDEAPLTLIAMLRGEGWLMSDHAEPTMLRPGGVAIVRGPDHYTVADNPSTPPMVIIQPGQFSTTVDGAALCEVMTLGPRTWGDGSIGSMTMLTGTYQSPSEISRLLLAALPAVIVVPEDAWDCRFLTLLNDEMVKQDAGQEVVLDRLLDLVLVEALRAWSASPGAEDSGPRRTDHDAVVTTALRLIHDDPAHPWSVASLASGAGVSRAALARRFTEMMGTPPMAYLTEWRLALAADLLREPAATVGSVARQVGYGSPFALSTAFKRLRGVSPREYRRVTSALSTMPYDSPEARERDIEIGARRDTAAIADDLVEANRRLTESIAALDQPDWSATVDLGRGGPTTADGGPSIWSAGWPAETTART